MKSEWRVTSNIINGQKVYAIYRLLDASEVDHSGNREYAGEYVEDRKTVEIAVDWLNQEQHEWVPSENTSRWHCKHCGIYEDYQNVYTVYEKERDRTLGRILWNLNSSPRFRERLRAEKEKDRQSGQTTNSPTV